MDENRAVRTTAITTQSFLALHEPFGPESNWCWGETDASPSPVPQGPSKFPREGCPHFARSKKTLFSLRQKPSAKTKSSRLSRLCRTCVGSISLSHFPVEIMQRFAGRPQELLWL